MTSAYSVRSEMRIAPSTDISASRLCGGAVATDGSGGRASAVSGGGGIGRGDASNGVGGVARFWPLLAWVVAKALQSCDVWSLNGKEVALAADPSDPLLRPGLPL